jgi:hypothetical protein
MDQNINFVNRDWVHVDAKRIAVDAIDSFYPTMDGRTIVQLRGGHETILSVSADEFQHIVLNSGHHG